MEPQPGYLGQLLMIDGEVGEQCDVGMWHKQVCKYDHRTVNREIFSPGDSPSATGFTPQVRNLLHCNRFEFTTRSASVRETLHFLVTHEST